MDVLKQKGKDCKRSKEWLKKTIPTGTRRWSRPVGAMHIREKDYGVDAFNSLILLTNKYVRHLKRDLKREYRAVKRGEKHKTKKEISQILLDE